MTRFFLSCRNEYEQLGRSIAHCPVRWLLHSCCFLPS